LLRTLLAPWGYEGAEAGAGAILVACRLAGLSALEDYAGIDAHPQYGACGAAILPAGAMTLGPSLRPILAGGPQEARTASRPHFPRLRAESRLTSRLKGFAGRFTPCLRVTEMSCYPVA
jgi:hypothetical protein